jgi:serralysin
LGNLDSAAMRHTKSIALAAFVAAAAAVAPAFAYNNNDRWTFTASGGAAGPVGTPITLTWGLADDGTLVQNVTPGVNRNSNLIAKLDSWYGAGPGGSDLTQRPWFGYLASSYNRWAEVSGVAFNYEPNDDGANHNVAAGVTGVRADVRLAGARYDGTVGVNIGTAGYTIAPDFGDVFLDTDDNAYYSNAANNAFSLRHTLMHELGHSLGLGHLTSSNSLALLEPFTQTNFDGPQHDDIRGVQFLYGDALEKNGGNNSIAAATPLGIISGDSVVSIGTDGGESVVTAEMSDFVSINRSADIDVFSFSVTGASQVNVTMTPLGFSYAHQAQGLGSTTIQSDRVGDLALEVRQNGVSLGISNGGGLGVAETLGFATAGAGNYTVHVTGTTTATQLYRLDVAVTSLALPGDYTGDGLVDAADYTRWRDTLGGTMDLAADGDGSGAVDPADYGVWASAYGSASPGAAHGAATQPFGAVPEPGALWLAGIGVLFARFRHANC